MNQANQEALIPHDHKVIMHQGGELEGCEIDGVWYVAMQRACRRLRLDWSSQHKRLLRDPILCKGMVMMTIPSPGGSQESICLRLDLFWGWLFKLELSRLAPDIAEQIMPLQAAGYQALYERFSSPATAAPAALHDNQIAALAARVTQLEAQLAQSRMYMQPRELHAQTRRRALSAGARQLATQLEALQDQPVHLVPKLATLMQVEERTITRWLRQLQDAGVISAVRKGRYAQYVLTA